MEQTCPNCVITLQSRKLKDNTVMKCCQCGYEESVIIETCRVTTIMSIILKTDCEKRNAIRKDINYDG